MKTVVIKWGSFKFRGHGAANKGVVQDILQLQETMRPVIVHGGGKEITEALSKAGIKSKFVQGHRVTDKATMEIVEMVLSGKVNKAIVGLINIMGGRAIGISGKDGNLIVAKKKPGKISLGVTGVVKEVQPEILKFLLKNNVIPVVSPVSVDAKGRTYNINADSVAAEVAVALKARCLIFLSNVAGVLLNPEDKKSVLPLVKIGQINKLKQEGQISSGMLPKLEAGKKALDSGVKYVHVIDGKRKRVLRKLLAGERVGTRIMK